MDLFFYRVWGFDPEVYPAILFSDGRLRDRLLEKSNIGDRLILAATTAKPTAKHERGRLLGMVEMGREAKYTEEILNTRLDKTEIPISSPIFPVAKNWFARGYGGNFRFPFAIPIIKAWRFKDQPFTKATLSKIYSYKGVIKILEHDKEIILNLDAEKIEINSGFSVTQQKLDLNAEIKSVTGDRFNDAQKQGNKNNATNLQRAKNLTDTQEVQKNPSSADGIRLDAHQHEENNPANSSPSQGPPPSAGKRAYEVPERKFSYVYWAQFGRYNAWKAGYSHNPQKRMDDINTNIPYEVTREQWEIVDAQKTSLSNAYVLEQKIIKRLYKFSIGGEMFKCSKKQFEEAWQDIVLADTDNN